MTDAPSTDPATSARLSRIRQRDTGPELDVRRRLHRAGFRFRVQGRDLPGSPDIVLPRYRTSVFVNGCFWHGHDCRAGRLPKRNAQFWRAKIERNRERDAANATELKASGWHVATIWTCELEPATIRLLEQLEAERSALEATT